jgi:hypothetical protein
MGGVGLVLWLASVAQAGSMVTILAPEAPFAQALARNGQMWTGFVTPNYELGGRWRDSTLTSISYLPGRPTDNHTGISDDGNVVSGDLYLDDFVAFRWENGTMELLLDPADDWSYTALCNSVSGDGSVVVGSAGVGGTGLPVYWQGGVQNLLPLPVGDTGGWTSAISGDGRTIVGTTYGPSGYHPVVWRDGVVSMLPKLPGGAYDFETAIAVSDDGSTVVGTVDSNAGTHYARWVNGNLELLSNHVITGVYPQNFDVSTDGSIILVGGDYPGPSGSGALVWRQELGLRPFPVYASHFGVSLTGALGASSDIYQPYQMTPDGRSFAGDFYDQTGLGRAYMVYLDPADFVIPEPSTLSLAGLAAFGLLWARRRSLTNR